MSKKKCIDCKHLNILAKCPCTKNSKSWKGYNILSIEEEDKILNELKNCEEFESMFIEYPIEVNSINLSDSDEIDILRCDSNFGKPVRIRPVGEPEINTYLGVYIGEVPIQKLASYSKENKELKISDFMYNPAIYVPELEKVIYGCESWWSFIENEDELKIITDETINDTWYVKVLRERY